MPGIQDWRSGRRCLVMAVFLLGLFLVLARVGRHSAVDKVALAQAEVLNSAEQLSGGAFKTPGR